MASKSDIDSRFDAFVRMAEEANKEKDAIISVMNYRLQNGCWNCKNKKSVECGHTTYGFMSERVDFKDICDITSKFGNDGKVVSGYGICDLYKG